MFLDNLLHGHEAISGLVKADELAHFDKVTVNLKTTPDGQIDVSSVVQYLKEAHGPKAQVIGSASSLLESLILAHAHFPFSEPVHLTRDSLLRAVILLTWLCDKYFRQSVSIDRDDLIRTRSETSRLQFIFSALACPSTGLPTGSDLVDVLCRLNYPMARRKKPENEPIRRPASELQPLGERLQLTRKATVIQPVATTELRPLADVVALFPLRWEEPVKDVGLQAGDSVEKEEFVKWAKRVRISREGTCLRFSTNDMQVRLLDVLHQLFEVFFRET